MSANPAASGQAQGAAHPRSAGLLRSTTIRVRLIVAFSALLALLLATAAMGAWQLDELGRVATANQRVERVIGDLQSEIRSDSVRVAVLARSDDVALRQMLTPQTDPAGQRIAQLQKELDSMASLAGDKPLLADTDVKAQAYFDARQRVLDRMKADRVAESASLLGSALQPAVRAYLGSLKTLSDFHAGDLWNGSGSARTAANTGLQVLFAVCLVGAVLQFFSCWLITASIVRPIRVAARIAQKVAAGDLTVKVRVDGRDEGTQLLQSLFDMIGNLRALVGEVVSGAHTVTGTSAQIAHGNLDLAQRTEQQAGTLDETSSSLEGLTSTVTQNAEHARKAAHLAIGASEVARRAARWWGKWSSR